MGLYQLCYSVGGAFEGVVFLEAGSPGAALWQAERDGVAPSSECDALELHPDDARTIPDRFIGRLLGKDEVTDLERILIAGLRKKPAAVSARRRRTGVSGVRTRACKPGASPSHDTAQYRGHRR
jgi:hypothetical protein